MLGNLSQVENANHQAKEHLVILEPSCGHGQIIWTLVEQQLDHLLQHYDTVSIVCIDLDPRVIEVCQKRYHSSPELHNNSKLSIEFQCQSFLASQAYNFIDTQESSTVVAIAGPPYGSKPEERDLPVQFVQHCMKEWNCKVIAFLVPQRFPKSIAGIGNDDSTKSSSVGLSYACHSEELANSTFFFKGKTAVKQPSRLQCYYQVGGTPNVISNSSST